MNYRPFRLLHNASSSVPFRSITPLDNSTSRGDLNATTDDEGTNNANSGGEISNNNNNDNNTGGGETDDDDHGGGNVHNKDNVDDRNDIAHDNDDDVRGRRPLKWPAFLLHMQQSL